jgi:hypothetical protein
MADPRTVKVKTPLRLILTACAIGGGLLFFIIFAVWQSGTQIIDARMSGKIVKKEFIPQQEEQIVLQKQGQVTTRQKDGEYILTVEVTDRQNVTKTYNVYLNKKQYDAVNVGDNYDVGPALVNE